MPIRKVVMALGLAISGGLAGCGGPEDSHRPGAAEPASAPVVTATPDGTFVRVGDQPQGIVYDAKQNVLAVAVRDPYRLLLLDPDTVQPRSSVALPGKVRHLQLSADGNDVLVPAETADQVLQVPVVDGPVVATKVQSHPHDATGADDGDIVVGNEFSGSFSVVRDGRVIQTVADLQQPGGVVTDGDVLAVVDVGAFTVSTYSLATFERTARVPAGVGPTHGVVLDGHRLLVADTRGGQLLLYSLDPLKELGHLDLPGSPYGLASDPTTDTVWVTLTATNQVVAVDVGGDAPKVIAAYPTVRQPDTVAVAPGSHDVWVTGSVDGEVQHVTR